MKFKHLNVPDQWQHYWTKYPEGYTIMEALISWVSQVDGMIDNQNEWNKRLDQFILEFDESLQTTVSEVLNTWKESGLLEEIVNRYAGKRISKLEDRTLSVETSKIDKGKVSIEDINQLKGLLDETFLTDNLKGQIAGDAPISFEIPDLSIANRKYADESISRNKIQGLVAETTNLYDFNKHYVPDKIVDIEGVIQNKTGWGMGYVPIPENIEVITILLPFGIYNGLIGSIAFYNENNGLVSYHYFNKPSGSYQNVNYVTFKVPNNAKYVGVTNKRTGETEYNFDNSTSLIIQEGYTISKINANITELFDLPVHDERINQMIETLNISMGNIYDFNEHYMGNFFPDIYGVLQNSSGWGSALIPIKENTTYSILIDGAKNYGGDIGGIVFRDENFENVKVYYPNQVSGEYQGKIYTTVQSPLNAKYLLVTVLRPETQVNPFDSRYGLKVVEGDKITDTTLKMHVINSNTDPNNISKELEGLEWVGLGDSLTERNSKATKFYHDYIVEKTGVTFTNMGVSGTGYKRTDENNTAFYQRALNIPTSADVITIFGSGNDLGAGVPIGVASDKTNSTLAGSINLTIDNIYSKLPTIPLGIISPTPWNTSDLTNPDSNFNKYVKVMEEICFNRGLPFLDLYHSSGLRPWEAEYRTLMYSRDGGNGVHPDENGHKLIYPQIREFLKTLV